MSSLPASPAPQPPSELPAENPPAPQAPAPQAAGPQAQSPQAPAPQSETAEPPAPQAAWAPVPAALIRIPYREWKGPRPRAVGLASALIMSGGVIALIGGVAAARAPLPELSNAAAELEKLGIEVSRFGAVFQALALATALVVFGLFALFAYLVREGRNWARVGGTILAGPALVAALFHGEVAQVFAVLAAVGGLGLLYRRECSRYFRPRQAQYRNGAGSGRPPGSGP